MLLLQVFDISIKDQLGIENLIADHLSRLQDVIKGVLDSDLIYDDFPDASLMFIYVYVP